MKSKQPPLVAIFFMTYFHRDGGAMAPSPPWIRYCITLHAILTAGPQSYKSETDTPVILVCFQGSVCVYCLWFWITVLRFSKWNTVNHYMSISFSTVRTQQDYTSKHSLSILKWSALDCHCLTYFHDWRLRALLELFTLIWSMGLTKTSATARLWKL